LQLDFRLFCSLSWSAFSTLPAFILFFFIIFFLEKKRILGNHPKLGDDSIFPLLLAYCPNTFYPFHASCQVFILTTFYLILLNR